MRTLVWDVDDVLNDLTRIWLEKAWKVTHPACQLSHGQLEANPPHELLGIPLAEYLASLDRCRASRHFQEMKPTPELLSWFKSSGHRYNHMVLTATPLGCVHHSAAWVLQHFGRWVRSFHFLPSHRPGENLPAYDQNKGDLLARLGGADLFVDDCEQNVEDARRNGVEAILFPRPWNSNRGMNLPEFLEVLCRWERGAREG